MVPRGQGELINTAALCRVLYNTIYCIPYTIYHISYTTYYIPYTVYRIRNLYYISYTIYPNLYYTHPTPPLTLTIYPLH